MAFSVQQIAQALGVEYAGNPALEIISLSAPDAASSKHLAMALNEKYVLALAKSDARAAIIPIGVDWQALGLEAAIFVAPGRGSMAMVSRVMDPGPAISVGIHSSAVIDKTAQIGFGAAIGPLVVIGANVKIGENIRLGAHVTIAENTVIGDNALILSGVHIGSNVSIGHNFIAQPGVVIGADGLSFQNDNQNVIENIRRNLGDRSGETIGKWHRIHSLGSVTIGNDVELGANAAIDKGSVEDTKIGNGTKIDNLVHIAHNVLIGEDCLICAQVGFGGSVKLGNRVILAGKCGVGDNLTIGDDVFAGGATKIFTNTKAKQVLLGNPALDMHKNIELQKATRRLPRFLEKIRNLEKRLGTGLS